MMDSNVASMSWFDERGSQGVFGSAATLRGGYLFTDLPRPQTPGSLRTGWGFQVSPIRLELQLQGPWGCLLV